MEVLEAPFTGTAYYIGSAVNDVGEGDFLGALGNVASAAGGRYLKLGAKGGGAVARAISGGGDEVVSSGARASGALSDDVASTFKGGEYTTRTLDQDLLIHRAYGGDSGPSGLAIGAGLQ